MTDRERREAAKQFFTKWDGKGKEKKDGRSYWEDFLHRVFGVENITDRLEYEKDVYDNDGKHLGSIDVYIPETHVLIEQKSLNIALDKPQPGHNGMTPFEQAKMYDDNLPHSEKAKWIILSNFKEIWVYDMDAQALEPQKFLLSELINTYSTFEFLVDSKTTDIVRQEDVSIEAGNFVSALYDAFSSQYIDISQRKSQEDLNKLCVRIVFCLYAEDAHLFGDNGHMFHDYMNQFETRDMRKALIDLFKILDTKEDEREVDVYDNTGLYDFPYVNGGLFADENIEIPQFTEEIRTTLLSKGSREFNWASIGPTVFGSVFESTIATKQRRENGMHYTSVLNLHKVLDSLFLNDLWSELNSLKKMSTRRSDGSINPVPYKKKAELLDAFQDKLAKLIIFDPACGSGNFLTESYISLRRLENEVIKERYEYQKDAFEGQISFGNILTNYNPVKVSIEQFYGIELDDFAVTVARTALWIAESQMLKETEDILMMKLQFLPLRTNAVIKKANALEINWQDVVKSSEVAYLVGNPPFYGGMKMTESQKAEIRTLFNDCHNCGEFDYVTGWYNKAAEYIRGTNIHCAFVSTNSICQGEQVTDFWSYMYQNYQLSIDFGFRTFAWENDAKKKARVHCIIVGFSLKNNALVKRDKFIVNEIGEKFYVENITPYLTEGETVFIQPRSTPICKVPEMRFGSMPRDGGGFVLSADARKELIAKEPLSEQWIKPYIGAAEFLNNKERYCLWLVGAEPAELRKCQSVMSRIEAVRNFRASSKAEGTRKFAQTPTLFCQIAQPDSNYIMVPKTSSGRRKYVPMGFQPKEVIASDLVFLIPDATLYHFGVLMSDLHNAWMRQFAGRLKSDYRYSKDIVYNTFPWPEPTPEQKQRIEETAQMILDVRAAHKNSTLSDLYDPLTMPPELKKAHKTNDRAVKLAYGFRAIEAPDSVYVEALLKKYKDITG